MKKKVTKIAERFPDVVNPSGMIRSVKTVLAFFCLDGSRCLHILPGALIEGNDCKSGTTTAEVLEYSLVVFNCGATIAGGGDDNMGTPRQEADFDAIITITMTTTTTSIMVRWWMTLQRPMASSMHARTSEICTKICV